jgi:hypothetical protein
MIRTFAAVATATALAALVPVAVAPTVPIGVPGHPPVV